MDFKAELYYLCVAVEDPITNHSVMVHTKATSITNQKHLISLLKKCKTNTVLVDKTNPTKEAPAKVKPEVDTELLASIMPSTLEEGCIYVHCKCANPGDDLLVRIWRTTYLIDHHSSAKTQLLHAENITIAPQWSLVPKGCTHNFLLIFGSLPKSCTQFDLIEEITQPGGFEIRNISRNESDVYHINIF